MNRGTGLGPLSRSKLGRGGRGGGHGGGGSRWVVGLRSLRRPPPCLSRTRINLCDVCQICTLSGLHGHRPCRRHRSGLICGGGGGDGSGDVSAGLIGGDHNAKGTFALSAAPRRTNGREHARGRARARARACGVSACRPRARPFSVSLYIHTTPHHTPHHTTPHHITPHHLVLRSFQPPVRPTA